MSYYLQLPFSCYLALFSNPYHHLKYYCSFIVIFLSYTVIPSKQDLCLESPQLRAGPV